MKEVWYGIYGDREFRVTVKFGKIVGVEGDLAWAKGLRIRHFKRTVWKACGDVEREEERCIEVSPQDGEAEEEIECIGPNQEEIEAAPGEISRVVDGLQLDDPVPELQQPTRPETTVSSVRRRRRETEVFPGMNLKKALRAARRMGCTVHNVRRSGEVRVFHPNTKKRINANRRKKDASRALTTFLIQLQTVDQS